jgi:hypothetical protein
MQNVMARIVCFAAALSRLDIRWNEICSTPAPGVGDPWGRHSADTQLRTTFSQTVSIGSGLFQICDIQSQWRRQECRAFWLWQVMRTCSASPDMRSALPVRGRRCCAIRRGDRTLAAPGALPPRGPSTAESKPGCQEIRLGEFLRLEARGAIATPQATLAAIPSIHEQFSHLA